ncbi:MAG: glycosyltransferase [Planctomycetota bacterium]
MRLAILWTNVSGYSAACWRRLAERDGVELCILTLGSGAGTKNTAFADKLGEGLPIESHDPATLTEAQVAERLEAFKPDAILVVGWAYDAYVRAAFAHADRHGSKVIQTMDNPWQGTWKQWVTCLRRRKLVARADAVLVPGVRSLQFARHLGVPWDKIHVGMYGYDDRTCVPQAVPDTPPRRFLFVGRYVESKGVTDLLQGYRQYHGGRADAFELVCHGAGPMGEQIGTEPGVTEGGFVQPDGLPGALAASAALILPSHHEHWGVIVAEALACARPVICTNTTGSAPELVRDRFNGIVVPAHSPDHLAAAMREIEDHPAAWRAMAERGPGLAAPFSASRWADLLQRVVASL